MMHDEKLFISGCNAILEALDNSKPIEKILIKKNYHASNLHEIFYKAKQSGIIIQEVEKTKLDFICKSKSHQGIIALCLAKTYCELEDILVNAKNKFIIILDEITDPRNFGAIIRTAEAACVDGIIIPKRRSAGLTQTVSKTSCGALANILIARVANLTDAINKLKQNNFWIFAADMSGDIMYKIDLRVPVGLIIGSEGFGIKKLVLKNCDAKIKIPMMGQTRSLNASVAAGILIYEIIRQRSFL